MSSSDSQDDGEPYGPVVSYEAETPRGGFMARPGFKTPPRHAVVVRQGDVPHSDNIPRARPSVPPAAPSARPALKQDDVATLPAIPKATAVPRIALDDVASTATPVAHPSEPAPPLSDSPFVTSAREYDTPSTRRSHRSRQPILAAALIGVVLGLASVAASMRARAPESRTLDAATSVAATPPPVAARLEPQPSSLPAPSASAIPTASAENGAGGPAEKRRAPRPRITGGKRSIF